MSEPGSASVRPIIDLFRADCKAFWATTFNIDLAFFSEYLLRRLGDAPLNAVVLADQECLDESLARTVERQDLLANVNRRWLLRGVRIGHGRFHPKSYLTVTPRHATLLVGSGNLSRHGIDTGREVFVSFRSGDPAGDAAINTWRTWMRQLVSTIGDTRLAERFTDLETRLPANTAPAETAPAHSQLLHNLTAPLANQLTAALDGINVDEVHATAPFYDERGEALGQLIDNLQPRRLAIYTSSTTSVNGNLLRQRLERSHAKLDVYTYQPDAFTHAKLVGATAGDQGWIMSGSANLSRAALTLSAADGNVELAVLAAATAGTVREAFLPPGVTADLRSAADLAALTMRSDDEAVAVPYLTRLERATFLPDGRVQLIAGRAFEQAWRLADNQGTYPIDTSGDIAVTVEAADGPLVRLVDDEDGSISNWCVIDDPIALTNILYAGDRSAQNARPVELTATDLDTPLGRALLRIHRDMVMDISEQAPVAGGGELDYSEAGAGDADNTLWERLERETLARDPRAHQYARLLAQTSGSIDALNERIADLLDAMRYRVPNLDAGNTRSVLQLLTPASDTTARAFHQWSDTARIRVRARNVLRRWAAAQTDERLQFIDPHAPVANLFVISSVFVTLWPYALGTADGPAELDADDLDDLWKRWFGPFVGTGNHDGWLDRTDGAGGSSPLHDQLTENITALCWLAIRPGSDHRARIVTWQPYLRAAFEHDLINDNEAVAAYLSTATGRQISPERVAEDLTDALTFLDDDLWCARTADELNLTSIQLQPPAHGQHISLRLDVRGIAEPLLDPRLPQLIAAVRLYRSVGAVAVFSDDHDWRIVIDPDEPAAYKAKVDAAMFESTPIAAGDIEDLAAHAGVLADLFPLAARAA